MLTENNFKERKGTTLPDGSLNFFLDDEHSTV